MCLHGAIASWDMPTTNHGMMNVTTELMYPMPLIFELKALIADSEPLCVQALNLVSMSQGPQRQYSRLHLWPHVNEPRDEGHRDNGACQEYGGADKEYHTERTRPGQVQIRSLEDDAFLLERLAGLARERMPRPCCRGNSFRLGDAVKQGDSGRTLFWARSGSRSGRSKDR